MVAGTSGTCVVRLVLLLLLLKLLLVLLLVFSVRPGVPLDSATPSVCTRSLHLYFTSIGTRSTTTTTAFKRPILQEPSDIHEDGAAGPTGAIALNDALVFAESAGGLGVGIR